MTIGQRIKLFVLVAAMFSPVGLRADEGTEPGGLRPDSLEDFAILGYVSAGAYSPASLIAMDNNARILFECRQGRSVEDLRSSGVEFSTSQLEFLIATQLMFRDGLGDLYTAFPILDVDDASKLRNEASVLADGLSVAVKSDAEALAAALDASGQSGSGYQIFFSYVLDGIVWGFFEEYQKVPRRTLSARRPFWSGEIWAMRPDRPFRARTRSIAADGLTLKVTSAAEVGNADDIFADPRQLKQALSRFSAGSSPEESAERQLLARFALVNGEGRWAIPVIDEVKKDTVFRAAETLTSNLVDAILEKVDLEGLEERYPFRNSQQALVVVYHELMWELIDRFERMGVVTRPDSFGAPGLAPSANRPMAGSVALLVDRRLPKPNRQDVVEPKRDSLEEEAELGAGK